MKSCERCHRLMTEICGAFYCYSCNAFRQGENIPSPKIINEQDYGDYLASDWSYTRDNHIHNQTKVKIGQYEIWCSELPSAICKREIPDLGIYLANAWIDKISPIWSTGTRSGLDFGLSLYPAVFCDWADMDIPDFEVLCRLVDYTWANIQQGKKVEIGCYGGHGRTGTLLACILIKAEHIGGQEAIDKVHKEYCHKAIETKKQEDLIKRYAKHLQ